MDLRPAGLGLGMAVFLLIAPGPAGAQEKGLDASITGLSKAFNPAISVNGLFYGLFSSLEHPKLPGDDLETGLKVQEFELAFAANVDPYLKADVILSLPGGEGIGLEEGYVTTLGLPHSLQVRVGKMYEAFGLHNRLHTHAFPFLDPPLVNRAIFGDEGLNDTGVELSWLAPLPWFSEVRGGVYDGQNEFVFNGRKQSDLSYLGRFENLWDLGPSATLRLGGSYAWGPHLLPGDTLSPEKEVRSEVWGGDAQIKWRPVNWTHKAAVQWQAEYMNYREWQGQHGSEPLDGYYSHLLVQLSRRWWVQGRYDEDWQHRGYWALAGPVAQTQEDHAWSGAVAYVPTEFQAYKLGYEARDDAGQVEYRYWLQLNVTVGSHPAHAY
jgi:hypothetical protein